MKAICLFLAVHVILCIHTSAQQPGWQWAQGCTGGYGGEGYSVTTDASGNVYTTGNFTSASMTFGGVTVSGPGNGNFFVVKYDASGNVLWARSAVGNSY